MEEIFSSLVVAGRSGTCELKHIHTIWLADNLLQLKQLLHTHTDNNNQRVLYKEMETYHTYTNIFSVHKVGDKCGNSKRTDVGLSVSDMGKVGDQRVPNCSAPVSQPGSLTSVMGMGWPWKGKGENREPVRRGSRCTASKNNRLGKDGAKHTNFHYHQLTLG